MTQGCYSPQPAAPDRNRTVSSDTELTVMDGTMRLALTLCLIVSVAACGGNSTAPSTVSADTTTNVAGTWSGTIASTNHSPMSSFQSAGCSLMNFCIMRMHCSS
jgi:hypothetical protein